MSTLATYQLISSQWVGLPEQFFDGDSKDFQFTVPGNAVNPIYLPPHILFWEMSGSADGNSATFSISLNEVSILDGHIPSGPDGGRRTMHHVIETNLFSHGVVNTLTVTRTGGVGKVNFNTIVLWHHVNQVAL